jgi:thiol:disulfide interchange protein DsbC
MKTTPNDPAHARRAATLALALAGALAAGACTAQVPAAPRTPAAGPRPTAPAPARPEVDAADTRALDERLRALYPATRFGPAQPTAWPGVYEVAMGANLAYVDATGRYFLFGHLYDMPAQRDLTAARKDALARVDFASLPLADAITEVRGKGTRRLAIFSDPDCPYCRRLEAELRGLDDVTVHTFLMPLAALHPAARAKAVAVWCARDRAAAWKALMLRDTPPPSADCPHPVDRNVALGERLGIQGTPTLVAGDGRTLAGMASRDQIELWLSRSSAGANAAAHAATGTPAGADRSLPR